VSLSLLMVYIETSWPMIGALLRKAMHMSCKDAD